MKDLTVGNRQFLPVEVCPGLRPSFIRSTFRKYYAMFEKENMATLVNRKEISGRGVLK
jgi:hypothetical protein